MDQETFTGAVAAIHDAIAAGDTYQVNLTFPLQARFAGDPAAWYADLAGAQLGAFNAHLEFGDRHLLSASPELFFSLDGDRITTRPMKGTVRRGRWTEEDVALAARLAGSEKDRAENVMIVDLLRSDLGKVAEVGSVAVDRLFAVERYETVWQLTSTISARLGAGATLTDVFRALFPCGSVTGAPKRSTMQIIRALETGPRGPYCGAIGFAGPRRQEGGIHAVFNVPIRTVDLDLSAARATYGVGCGITWGSEAGERVRGGPLEGATADRTPCRLRPGGDDRLGPRRGLPPPRSAPRAPRRVGGLLRVRLRPVRRGAVARQHRRRPVRAAPGARHRRTLG